MAAMKRDKAPGLKTNFGFLKGGWLELSIPKLDLVRKVIGYGSNKVKKAVQESCLDFEGLAGLPLLRWLEFGGNANTFWLRKN